MQAVAVASGKVEMLCSANYELSGEHVVVRQVMMLRASPMGHLVNGAESRCVTAVVTRSAAWRTDRGADSSSWILRRCAIASMRTAWRGWRPSRNTKKVSWIFV